MNENDKPHRRELLLASLPSQAPEIGVWLAALSDSRERTHKAIAGIGEDELDWVSAPERHTIGTLLYHIAAIELDWLYVEILEQDFPDGCELWFPDDVSDAAGALTVVTGESASRHRERLHWVREQLLATLSGMSTGEFREVRHLDAYDVTPQWVVHHLLQHEAEHRGQIAILRKRFKASHQP
ncbi:MAG: DinB family protein [bacterium]